MGTFVDITGQSFGRWVVVKRVGNNESFTGTIWLCRCSCGAEKEVPKGYLKSGHSKSCGCLRSDIARKLNSTHGGSGTTLHRIWKSMRERCNNKNNKRYYRYGGRGILICERWWEFDAFRHDMGECPPGLTIDRINNDKGYSKENCRWATRLEQGQNRSSVKLNPVAVRVMRYMYEHGTSILSLARAYKVHRCTVQRVVHNRTWGNIDAALKAMAPGVN